MMQDHWIDVTYLRFASICGLNECAFLENNSTQVQFDAETRSLLAFATLGGKKTLVYPLLCRAIQRTLDLASSVGACGRQSGLIIRDTAYHQDCETSEASPSRSEVRNAFPVDLISEGPEPTYTTNPSFTGTCDLSLYRRTPSGQLSHGFQQTRKGKRYPDGLSNSSDDLNRKAWLGRKSWNTVKAFINVKGDESHSPFSMDIDDPNFLPDTKNGRRALKELTQAAGEIMLRQHRCFLYSVTIVGHCARLIRWDRSGALVSEPINLREDGDKLLAFIYALGRMDDHALGCDPTATLATEAEMKLWQSAVTAKLVADADWKDHLEQATDDDWPIYRLQVSNDDAFTARRRWRAYVGEGTPLPLGNHRNFLVGRPSSEGRRSPFRRGCKGFIALDVTTGDFVHLKDFWYADDLECPPEFVVYARLVEAGVRNIPTFLCGGYIPGDVSGNAQTTLNHEFDGHLQCYTHGRFVVREVGKPLESYENTFQLTTVFRQALIAHQDAWANAGLLHGDINDRSIVIHNGRGLLTDWDLTLTRENMPRTPSMRNRVGTWRYISGLLSSRPLKPYELADDLESFIHVLVILTLRFQDHRLGRKDIRSLVKNYDEINTEGSTNLVRGSFVKARPFGILEAELAFGNGRTSRNFVALLSSLIFMGREHDRVFSESDLRAYRLPHILTTEQLNTLLKTAIHNPAYAAAASRSPFRTHERILRVFEDVLGREDGWVTDDKKDKDALQGV